MPTRCVCNGSQIRELKKMVVCQFCETYSGTVDEVQVHQLACADGEIQPVSEQQVVLAAGGNEGSSNHQILVNVKNVDYILNEKAAWAKKVKACSREAYELEWKSRCCNIIFSTAAFEMFRSEVVKYLRKHPLYVIKEEETRDKAQNVPQDVIKSPALRGI